MSGGSEHGPALTEVGPGTAAAPSTTSTLVFVAIVALVAGLFAAAILRRSAGDGGGERPTERRFAVLALVFASALVVPGVLAAVGMLDRYAPLPAPGLLVIGAVTVGTVALAFSSVGTRLAGLPLALLVGYQAFRVPLEWVLHRLHIEGVIPVEMTWAGRNFDVVTGISAAVLGLAVLKARPGRGVVLLWNVVGLALLANIIAVSLLAAPVPFRYFRDGPPNLLPSTFPYVWLPTLLVQAALLGHLLVFRALRRAGSD